MKKLTVSLPDQLDKRLREYTETTYYGLKGGLSLVTIAAIEAYLKAHAR